MTSIATMRPVTFDGCFGWLHRPASAQRETGVVLCSPFGYDALCVHRGWRAQNRDDKAGMLRD